MAETPVPSHPDLDIVETTTAFERHLRVDVVRFRHRRFAGGWSGERTFDIVRRGAAAAVRHLRVDVVRFRHRRFAGGWSGERTFDIVRRGAAAAVLLYDPDRDSVVLIEQFRLPPLYVGRSPWQTEAVAGLVDTAEAPEEVARREVREETGLDLTAPLLPIQRMLPACGSFDEVVWLYCGRVDSRAAGGVHGLAEEQEDIRVVVKSLAEAEAMLDAGQIESSHTVICLYWLLRHRSRLRREWGGG